MWFTNSHQPQKVAKSNKLKRFALVFAICGLLRFNAAVVTMIHEHRYYRNWWLNGWFFTAGWSHQLCTSEPCWGFLVTCSSLANKRIQLFSQITTPHGTTGGSPLVKPSQRERELWILNDRPTSDGGSLGHLSKVNTHGLKQYEWIPTVTVFFLTRKYKIPKVIITCWASSATVSN